MASNCGTHNYFTKGCPGCQRATRTYERQRQAALRNGTWKPRVDVGQVVAHIRTLRDAGMSLADIARASNIPVGTVRAVASAGRRWVCGDTAEAIFAVVARPSLPAGYVPVAGSVRRIRSMVAEGYGFAAQSRLLGVRKEQLWQWAWMRNSSGPITYISEFNASAIDDLYRQLIAAPAPTGPSAVRARNEAARRGWHDHWAWPDDRIDDPAARPYLGDDPVDEVKVDRALAGQPVELDELEAAVALRRGLAAGLAKTTLQTRLRIGTAKADRLLAAHDLALAA